MDVNPTATIQPSLEHLDRRTSRLHRVAHTASVDDEVVVAAVLQQMLLQHVKVLLNEGSCIKVATTPNAPQH